MSEERNDNRTQQADSWVGLILRLILSAIVIAIAAFLTPGFTIDSIWAVLLAAVIISVVGYLIQEMTDLHASPFGRGLSVLLYRQLYFMELNFGPHNAS